MGGYIGATAVGLTTTAADVQGDITSTDTTPELILKNTSEEDTEGGREGKITFKGEQSGGEETTLAQIQASHDGTSDDEKGDLIFKVNDGSDGNSPTERLRIGSDGATTITTEGNEDTLVLKSNDADSNAGPKLQFNRNSASPADDDFLGEIKFSGRNDAGQAVDYAKIAAKLQDASDGTEDIRLSLKSIVAGTERERVTIQPTEVVINEDSQDLDFRVESSGNVNMFRIDGGNNIIGIGRNPSSSTGSVLQLEGADGMALRRPSQTNSFTIRPQASTDGIRFTQEGTGDVGHFDQYGRFGVGVSPSYALHVKKASSADFVSEINNSGTDPYGMVVRFSGAAPDNNVRHFQYYTDISAVRYVVDADGDVRNHDNSYGAISDERVKEQISDATSQWDDIKALRVRKFKLKDDVRQYGDDAKFKLGLISQETELVSPNLIQEVAPDHNHIISSSEFGTLYEDGDDIPEGKQVGDVKETHTTVKGIRYSILYMKAVKALQEAMTRIETLETENTAIKARLDALEA